MTPRQIIAEYLADFLALSQTDGDKAFGEFADDLLDRLEGDNWEIVDRGVQIGTFEDGEPIILQREPR